MGGAGEQRILNGRAIDRFKGLVAARTDFVDRAGEALLARPRLSADQEGERLVRKLANGCEESEHLGGRSDEPPQTFDVILRIADDLRGCWRIAKMFGAAPELERAAKEDLGDPEFVWAEERPVARVHIFYAHPPRAWLGPRGALR